jgi:hypothetical protein
VSDLARLSDAESIPCTQREVSADDALSPPEAYLAGLVAADAVMSVGMLVDISPMSEEETFRSLARLVTTGIIRVSTSSGSGFSKTLGSGPRSRRERP